MFRSISAIEALSSSNPKIIKKALKSKDAAVRRIAEGRHLITLFNEGLTEYLNAVLDEEAMKVRFISFNHTNEFEPELWNDFTALDKGLLELVPELRVFSSKPMKVLELSNVLVTLKDCCVRILNLNEKHITLFKEEIGKNPDTPYKSELIGKMNKIKSYCHGYEALSALADRVFMAVRDVDNLIANTDRVFLLTTTAYNSLHE